MSIYKKLFEAKKEIGKISKDSTNPFFKSKYFDINKLLEHVEPILQDKGLLILQPIIDSVVVTQIIDSETAEMVSSSLEIKQSDPQKKGIEITYYRRYTLSSLLGLQAEDNDGNIKQPTKPTPPKDYTRQIARVKACKNLKQLGEVWADLSKDEQKAVLTVKDAMKAVLTQSKIVDEIIK